MKGVTHHLPYETHSRLLKAPCSSLPLSVETRLQRSPSLEVPTDLPVRSSAEKEIGLQILFVKEWSQIRDGGEGNKLCSDLARLKVPHKEPTNMIIGTFCGHLHILAFFPPSFCNMFQNEKLHWQNFSLLECTQNA